MVKTWFFWDWGRNCTCFISCSMATWQQMECSSQSQRCRLAGNWIQTHLLRCTIFENYHKYSFFPNTIREWNSLPEDIATLPNLDSLKKKHYFNDCIPLCVLINWLTNVYSLAHQFVICTFVSGFTYFFTLKKPHKNLHFWSRSGFVKEEEED